MSEKQKLEWRPVNTEALKGNLAKTLSAYLEAKKLADVAWTEFRDTVQPIADKGAPKGQEAVVIFKRGRLLIAYKAKTAKKATADEITL